IKVKLPFRKSVGNGPPSVDQDIVSLTHLQSADADYPFFHARALLFGIKGKGILYNVCFFLPRPFLRVLRGKHHQRVELTDSPSYFPLPNASDDPVRPASFLKKMQITHEFFWRVGFRYFY